MEQQVQELNDALEEQRKKAEGEAQEYRQRLGDLDRQLSSKARDLEDADQASPRRLGFKRGVNEEGRRDGKDDVSSSSRL